MALLNIVIPVYEVEEYVGQLMETLLPQLTDDIECVVVDDGSKDSSINIVQQCVECIPHRGKVTILSQDNKGPGGSRNTGMQYVRAHNNVEQTYITFLDADDYVLPGYIDTILSIIWQKAFDILHFNVDRESSKGRIQMIRLAEEDRTVVVDQAYLQELVSKGHWYAWQRVFRLNILEHFQFPENMLMEDLMSLPFLYHEGQRIIEIPKSLLFYRYREGSILRSSTSEKLVNSLIFGIQRFRQYRESPYFCPIYKVFVVDALHSYRLIGFSAYREFVRQYHDDIGFLHANPSLYSLKKKDRMMLAHPYLHFCFRKVFHWLRGRF